MCDAVYISLASATQSHQLISTIFKVIFKEEQFSIKNLGTDTFQSTLSDCFLFSLLIAMQAQCMGYGDGCI